MFKYGLFMAGATCAITYHFRKIEEIKRIYIKDIVRHHAMVSKGEVPCVHTIKNSKDRLNNDRLMWERLNKITKELYNL
jgi:hypothetical protein